MSRTLFLGSLGFCLLFIGLAHVPDPRIFGIEGEPDRILFYGGSGLLAGLFGFVALGSGIYLGATRFAGMSEGGRRLMLALMWVVLIVVSSVFVFRFLPGCG